MSPHLTAEARGETAMTSLCLLAVPDVASSTLPRKYCLSLLRWPLNLRTAALSHSAATVDGRYEWRGRRSSEAGNPVPSLHQQFADIFPGCVPCPNHDDPRCVPLHGFEFSSTVTDVLVLRERDPPHLSNKSDPGRGSVLHAAGLNSHRIASSISAASRS